MTDGTIPSRRSVLAGGATLAAATLLPQAARQARAQAPAKWRRYNVASPQGQAMLSSYATAISALLKLPPTDPRNWYRIGFTHYLDCPHGNWWLYPWHRGFTGWVEQIVRQFSGNPHFAFPYWDWTANPSVPAAMGQGVLSPGGPGFIPDLDTFAATFEGPLATSGYFASGSAQLQQLTDRGIPTNAALWDQLTDPSNSQFPSFFPSNGQPNVRNPSPLLDCVAGPAVSRQTVAAGMSARAYTANPVTPVVQNYFSSPKAAQHSDMVGFAVLEGQPHNMVHNNVGGIVHSSSGGVCSTSYTDTGGFMQAFLSPTDPLFFLHHSNLDRLWTAWTARQMAAGLPYLPSGPDLPAWSNEPFLFYCNAAGQPLPQAKAGDYATIGAFDYDYQPGSVGASGPAAALRGLAPRRAIRIVGQAAKGALLTTAAGGAPAANLVPVVPDLLTLATPAYAESAVVSVTLALPHAPRGTSFPVMADTGDAGARVEVGRVALFGHAMAHGPMTFSLPVGPALAALRQRGVLTARRTLRFTAVAPASATGPGLTAMGPMDVPVLAVVIDGG